MYLGGPRVPRRMAIICACRQPITDGMGLRDRRTRVKFKIAEWPVHTPDAKAARLEEMASNPHCIRTPPFYDLSGQLVGPWSGRSPQIHIRLLQMGEEDRVLFGPRAHSRL